MRIKPSKSRSISVTKGKVVRAEVHGGRRGNPIHQGETSEKVV